MENNSMNTKPIIVLQIPKNQFNNLALKKFKYYHSTLNSYMITYYKYDYSDIEWIELKNIIKKGSCICKTRIPFIESKRYSYVFKDKQPEYII